MSFDRSSLQARTFDKYLLIETLPLNPRWRDVIRSAEFSLSQAERQPMEDGDVKRRIDALRQELTQLRVLLREGRGLA